MTSWIGCGVIAWLEEKRYREDETVLVYFKGTSSAAMAEGPSARHRPPFAHGNDTAAGDWRVIVHHMFNRDDHDYRELCPQGVELMVFVPNPCVAKAHGPTTRTARYRPASTSKIPNASENTGPTRWPPHRGGRAGPSERDLRGAVDPADL